jgi:hypothetical protein
VTGGAITLLLLWAIVALQEKGRGFRESFLSKLALLLKGTVAAPSNRFGETLADEHLRGGEAINNNAIQQPGHLI